MAWLWLLLVSNIVPISGNYHQPQLAAAAGSAVVTFGSEESIFVAFSRGNIDTFGPPVRVAAVPGLNLGMHRGPRAAFSGKTVVVTAINGKTDGDLLAWRSTDNGQTWSGPVKVNDTPKAAREGLHAMVALPNGRLFATWLDLRNLTPGKPGTELFGAYSDDGGKSWSKNLTVYHSPSGTICQCCHPSLDVDGKGDLHVMWRNAIDGNRDLYTAASTDGGKTWSAASKLGVGSWKLDACPMDGGGAAHQANGELVTVWRRESKLYLDTLGKPEQLLGEGKNAAIAVSAQGTYLIWQSAKGVEVRRPGHTASDVLDTEGIFPQIIALSNGRVLAAWERNGTLQFKSL